MTDPGRTEPTDDGGERRPPGVDRPGPPTTTHSWLQAPDGPPAWPAPADHVVPATPPVPAVPGPSSGAVPAPIPPPPPSRLPTTYSGYDVPAPDSRWPTYLQRDEQSGSASDRPSIRFAALLVIAGAGLVALGSLLDWATFPDRAEAFGLPRSVNGFTDLAAESRDGPFFAVFAAILGLFGVITVVWRRRVPILIVGMVIAGFGLVAAAIDLVDVANPDSAAPAAFEPGVGPGLPVVIGGFAIAFAGLLLGATRRSRPER